MANHDKESEIHSVECLACKAKQQQSIQLITPNIKFLALGMYVLCTTQEERNQLSKVHL
jgi:phage protein U